MSVSLSMEKDVLVRIYEQLNEGTCFHEKLLVDSIFEIEKLRKENQELKEERELRFKHWQESNGILITEY